MRELYEQNEEARKFLRQHPEFDNGHIDHPPHSAESSEFYNSEREPSLKSEKAKIIQEALSEYPDLYASEMLELYFDGISLEELRILLEHPSIGTTHVWIHKTKDEVYEWAKSYRGRPMKNQYTVANTLETKELFYKGKRELVHKIKSRFGKIWIDSKGRKLDDGIQDILDATQWEMIDLTGEGGTYEDGE